VVEQNGGDHSGAEEDQDRGADDLADEYVSIGIHGGSFMRSEVH
jgi:hypothetical protein